MNVGKAAPWLVSLLLAVATGVLFLSGKQKDEALAQQVVQLQKMTDDYNKLAKDANDKVKSLVEDANEKIAYASLPVVPVKLTPGKPIFDSGLMLQIRNTSDKTIAITVSIERPSTGKTKVYEFTIDSGLGKNIGQTEGWAFIAGDAVKVTQPEHKPVGLTFQ